MSLHLGRGEAFGTERDGHGLCSRVTSKRFWMVRQGLTALLRRGRCSGQAPERVIGYCTFVGLASRGTLCTHHTCNRYIQCHCFQNGPIWNELPAGLRCFQGLAGPWWLPWILCALQSDASLQGGHWHTVSGPVRQLQKLPDPRKKQISSN